jgi:gliding motility-associated-like protein
MRKYFLYSLILGFIYALSSCEKCASTILCPYQNPQYFSTLNGDTAIIGFPNVFTPNGDGVNDIFELPSYGVNSLQFTIYDPSGRQIYQSNNTYPSWDGTINGKPADVGIYAVRVSGISQSGTRINLDGTVSILGGKFFGSNIPNTDGNFYLELKNCQFPTQFYLSYGGFDSNIPSGEYLNVIQVHNCH